LRKILGEAPDGSEYIETIPRRGYRFAEVVREVSPGLETEENPEHIRAVRTAGQSKKNAWIAGLGLGLVLALGLFLARERIWPHSAPAHGKIMLAVLPFENLSGDAQQDYLSAGLTEEMITQLAILEPSRLGVIA